MERMIRSLKFLANYVGKIIHIDNKLSMYPLFICSTVIDILYPEIIM